MKEKDCIEQTIWSELNTLKFSERYLAMYLDILKCRKKWVTIFSVIFSSGGLFGGLQCDSVLWIGLALTIGTQLFSIIQEHIIMSATDLAKVMELRILYINAFNKVEKMWAELKRETLSPEEATNKFYQIRSEFAEIHKIDNEINLPTRKKINTKACKEAVDYLKQYFYPIQASAE